MAKKVTVAIGIGKPKGPPPPDDTAPEDMPLPGDEEASEEGPEAPGEPPEAPESEGEEEAEGSYPEFDIPKGLDLGDLKPGEEKEVLCVIKKTSDTEACITQVDGIELSGQGGGMTGPPPAAPPAEGPPAPPPAALAAMLGGGGGPPGMPPAIMPPPGPEPPGGAVRARAVRAGLM